MIKPLVTVLCLSLLFSCHGKTPDSKKTAVVAKKADSLQKPKPADTANQVDNNDPDPSFDEVKNDLLASYNKIQLIDTTLLINGDMFHVHEKYYCLHDSTLVVPKKYLWGGDRSKDFITHNFASDILIVKNKDTIFKRTFKKSDFKTVVHAEEEQHAILFDPYFIGYKKRDNSIAIGYSISIPLTDVGVPAYIVIDLKGNYKILDEYSDKD